MSKVDPHMLFHYVTKLKSLRNGQRNDSRRDNATAATHIDLLLQFMNDYFRLEFPKAQVLIPGDRNHLRPSLGFVQAHCCGLDDMPWV